MIVIGKKVKAGKIQHLEIGKEYNVSEESAKIKIKNGQAELPKKKTTKKKTDKE